MGDLRTQFSILRQRSFGGSICTYYMGVSAPSSPDPPTFFQPLCLHVLYGDLRTQFSILRQRSFTRLICTYYG